MGTPIPAQEAGCAASMRGGISHSSQQPKLQDFLKFGGTDLPKDPRGPESEVALLTHKRPMDKLTTHFHFHFFSGSHSFSQV